MTLLKFYRPLVSQHLAAVLAGQKRQDRLVAYGEIVDQHPEFVADIRVMIGCCSLAPPGACDGCAQTDLSQAFSARGGSSIPTAGAPYALFSTEEAGWLTSEGLPSDVCGNDRGERAGQASGLAGGGRNVAGGGECRGEPAQATGLEATASECTKAYAAKKVCENMPGDPFGLLMRGCMAREENSAVWGAPSF